jgi:hypothetical protein
MPQMSNPGRSLHSRPDSLVAISTFAIQLTLRRLVRTRRGLPLGWIIVRLGVFMVAGWRHTTDCSQVAP